MDKEVFENSIRHLAPCDGAESCFFTVHGIHPSLQCRQMSSVVQWESGAQGEEREGGASLRGAQGKQFPAN